MNYYPRSPENRPPAAHSRESGNPPSSGPTWTPAYAGVTTIVIFTFSGGPQAHGYSVNKSFPRANIKMSHSGLRVLDFASRRV